MISLNQTTNCYQIPMRMNLKLDLYLTNHQITPTTINNFVYFKVLKWHPSINTVRSETQLITMSIQIFPILKQSSKNLTGNMETLWKVSGYDLFWITRKRSIQSNAISQKKCLIIVLGNLYIIMMKISLYTFWWAIISLINIHCLTIIELRYPVKLKRSNRSVEIKKKLMNISKIWQTILRNAQKM
jgi:hypothetical protein